MKTDVADTPLGLVHRACEEALQRLEQLFQPGCRLTLLMLTPGDPEAEILWTKNDPQELICAIQRFQLREALEAGEQNTWLETRIQELEARLAELEVRAAHEDTLAREQAE